MEFFGQLFGTDSIIKSVERIATEFIDTPEEKAKASTLFIKTLDPNGLMRRDISNTVRSLFKIYILTLMMLIFMKAFGVGDVVGVEYAIDEMGKLFVPVTASFTAILTASFGVNAYNIKKGN